MLADEGVVEIRPRRCAVVAQLSAQRLVEMFEVMAELEAMSARIAARRMTAAELVVLEQAHDKCHSAALVLDADGYFYANEHFHQTIYSGSHNGVDYREELVHWGCGQKLELVYALRPRLSLFSIQL